MKAALREGQNETAIYSGPLAANYPSDQWVDGELVAAPMYWPISREQPPGSYDLQLQAGETVIDLGTVEVAGVLRRRVADHAVAPASHWDFTVVHPHR
jgi:hypothetical protein